MKLDYPSPTAMDCSVHQSLVFILTMLWSNALQSALNIKMLSPLRVSHVIMLI